MRRALCEKLPEKVGQMVELPENEVRHLVSVLRMKPDDEFELLDGSGFRARAKITYRGKTTYGELVGDRETDLKLMALPIHLTMAMIKGDAMEWVIEKATELGVKSLTPIETEFTVVKTHKKGNDVFQERFQKISDQALKQCGRIERMEIESPISFEEALLNKNHLIWLDESLAMTSPASSHLTHVLAQNSGEHLPYQLVVGPEGGFSSTEKNRLLQLTGSEKQAITSVHLGSLILRAETAALLGVSLLVGDHYGRKN
jgi:16S rRNA (uracil1498-N3)-methyltransferase